MPGRYFLTSPPERVAQYLGAEAGAVAAEPPRHNIAPGQQVMVCDAGRRLVPMRWGIIPVGRVNARGRPVMETIVNARSETVFAKSAFDGVRRCIVPADGWYEWTGEKRRKTAWRITRKTGGLLAFAAICDSWSAPGGVTVMQVATLTCAPNAELRGIHHRMGVILEPDRFEPWLTGPQDAAARLMQPLPDGMFAITQATGVDWDGA